MRVAPFQPTGFFCRPVRLTIGLALSLGAPFLAGCAAPQTATPNPLCLNVADEPLWWVCLAELKSRGFELDQTNRQRRVVMTKGLTSSQFFELWGQDLATTPDTLEASLHTMRRRVSLSLEPTNPNRTCLTCQVSVERLSQPIELVAGRLRVGNLFGKAAGRMPRLASEPSERSTPAQWVPVGRDKALERDILRDVARTVQTRPVETEFAAPWKHCPVGPDNLAPQD